MAKATRTPTDLQIAHQAFIGRINSIAAPCDPSHAATADELLSIQAHLNEVLQAALTYSRAVIANVLDVTSVNIEDNTDCLSDAIADVTGPILTAAYRAEHQEAA
jgi:hypothetical protein